VDETGAEIAQADNTENGDESVRTEPKDNGILKKGLGIVRRFFSKPQQTPSTASQQLSVEQLQQDLDNLLAIRTRGGSDYNTPATRALDDKRIEKLRAAIESRTPQPQVETQPAQPTTAPEVPQEQPAEEPKAA